jgi:hypothetical protein
MKDNIQSSYEDLDTLEDDTNFTEELEEVMQAEEYARRYLATHPHYQFNTQT